MNDFYGTYCGLTFNNHSTLQIVHFLLSPRFKVLKIHVDCISTEQPRFVTYQHISSSITAALQASCFCYLFSVSDVSKYICIQICAGRCPGGHLTVRFQKYNVKIEPYLHPNHVQFYVHHFYLTCCCRRSADYPASFVRNGIHNCCIMFIQCVAYFRANDVLLHPVPELQKIFYNQFCWQSSWPIKYSVLKLSLLLGILISFFHPFSVNIFVSKNTKHWSKISMLYSHGSSHCPARTSFHGWLRGVVVFTFELLNILVSL